jgi:hypothetical protein
MGIRLEQITSESFGRLLEAALGKQRILPVSQPRQATPGTPRRIRVSKTRESVIHDHISAFCDRNGIVPVHTNPTEKSTIRPGYPDFFCCRDNRVIALEIKVPPNKLSASQRTEFPRIEADGVRIVICVESGPGAALRQASAVLADFFGITEPL